MLTEANKLDVYIQSLKREGGKLPCYPKTNRPHLIRISAASGANRRFLNTTEGRQRLNLAVQEIGLDVKHGSPQDRIKKHLEEDAELISRYLCWLEESGVKLPENPLRRGVVFLEQVKVEAGLAHNALGKHGSMKDSPDNQAIRMIESAVPRLGLEVRVLTQRVGHLQETLTYELLLENGTKERRHELADKPNARQQLYNTRSKLRLFCETLGFDLTACVGDEFVANFDKSVDEVCSKIESVSSRRKFSTEIRRWSDYYRQIVKANSMSEDFHQSFRHLTDMSGLTLAVLAKLLGVKVFTLSCWYRGESTPSHENVAAISRMEALCKLPSGSLVSKISQYSLPAHILPRQLPEFLRQNKSIDSRVCRQLPADFLQLHPEKQKEIVESVKNVILKSDSPYNVRLVELQGLPYLLKEWPAAVDQEFMNLSGFKTADRPPLGMKRSGRWGAATEKMARKTLSSFLGALRLPADAADIRLRGLGVPDDQLTLAFIACPLVVDWFIRFKCVARSQYTSFAINLLKGFTSMLRAETGWLRQRPRLAARLRPLMCGDVSLVSSELIDRARQDWEGVCQHAVEFYNDLCHELKPLIQLGRDPFRPIEGIVEMDDPMEAFEVLLQGMRSALPNRRTQPVRYHAAIRDCAIIALIITTGFRRNTLAQLDFTLNKTEHLIVKDDHLVLNVPRSFFKDPDSPFFGPENARSDYYNKVPNAFWAVDIFREYLSDSRPFLLSECHPNRADNSLFINSATGKAARMSPEALSNIYYKMVERHLVENKWRGTGIKKVWPSGSHSARHIRGTAVVKKTGSFQLAADANHHGEPMARKHYTRFTTGDRNRFVNPVLFENKVKSMQTAARE